MAAGFATLSRKPIEAVQFLAAGLPTLCSRCSPPLVARKTEERWADALSTSAAPLEFSFSSFVFRSRGRPGVAPGAGGTIETSQVRCPNNCDPCRVEKRSGQRGSGTEACAICKCSWMIGRYLCAKDFRAGSVPLCASFWKSATSF